jgi:regulator of PEP synthase PpsR (kinase-PPPase family)
VVGGLTGGLISISGYSERAHIMEEIEYCRRIYRLISGIRTLDVTNRSIIEETTLEKHALTPRHQENLATRRSQRY